MNKIWVPWRGILLHGGAHLGPGMDVTLKVCLMERGTEAELSTNWSTQQGMLIVVNS